MNAKILKISFLPSGPLTLRRQALPMIATVLLGLSSPTSAQTLIRCPDWQTLVKQSAPIVLAKSAPKTSFDTAVSRAGVVKTASIGSTNPSAKKPAKGTDRVAPSTSCPTYKVKSGDTLGSIAQSQLGSSKKHTLLLSANKTAVPSAKALRIGTVLTIPCTPTSKPSQASKPKTKSKGLFASLKSKPAVQPIPKTVAAVTPAPNAKPLPVWRAKSGEYLSDVVKRWGKAAGYKVIVSGPSAWRLNVPVKEVGTFEETLSRLVKGFSADGQPPSVRVFSNKVIKIGSVL